MEGWIKLHRKLTEWEWYKDNNTKSLFVHLLLMANHKDGRFQGQEVKRGQLITGRKVLSVQTGLSEQQIRTGLNKLISTNEITIKSTNKNSLISIIRYNSYQIESENTKQSTSEITNNQPTSNQQVTTNKNDKNVKNDKNLLEGEKISKEEIHKRLFRELKESTSWMEQFCMNQKCTIQEAEKHLIKFYQETVLKGEFKEELKELKNHFINWTKKGNRVQKIEPDNKSSIKDNWW